MKEVNKICFIVGICFVIWQANAIIQLHYARVTLNQCNAQANNNYSENWDNACKMLNKEKNCNLPVYRANEIENARDKNINRCIEVFKYNKNF